jgi:3-oxoacyl-[acyl-carrier-protein] synthase-3
VIRIAIAGTGAYLPPKRLTNDDLVHLVDTNDEWIRTRTGISERHILSAGAIPAEMGVEAARAALAAAGRSPADVDLLVVATNVSEQPIPGTAPFIATKLNLTGDVPFFDLKAGCAGFVYGLALAGAMVAGGLAQGPLVVGTEALSRFVNWEDRRTCVLFGDGAGAAFLLPTGQERGILGVSLHGDPQKSSLLRIEAGGVRLPASEETVRKGLHWLKMEGKGVFRSAVQMMDRATREALERAGLSPQDLDWVIPHQANLRIISALAHRLSLPRERFLVNIDRVANTSTASIPILLDEAVRGGGIRPGQLVALTAFGAGACYGTVILRW